MTAGNRIMNSWSLFWLTEIQRRQFDLRYHNPDLVEIDIERLVQQRRHRDGKGNDEHDHDGLQADPGHGAPVDIGALYFLWRNAAQAGRTAQIRTADAG